MKQLEVICLNLINFLKQKRDKLKNLQRYETKKCDTEKNDNTQIRIENHNELFENEEETIIKGAQVFLEQGHVETLEDGIITFATLIRGLKYKTTTKDEDGNQIIIFDDVKLENNNTRKL